jgi:Flp pilus assembly protein TadG
MRVNDVRTRGAQERGAVAVIVAIVATLVFGMAAFALDTGDLWQSRRNLIVGTDSAALAAAEIYATNGNGCAGTPATYMTKNDPEGSVTGCTFRTLGPGAGYVTVDGARTVDYTFAGVFGLTGRDVHSSTTAAYGQPTGLRGLRPLGLCADSPELTAWISSGMDTPFTATITYGKSAPDDCGANVPGNWGVLDFDGGANPSSDTKSWIEFGYPGVVTAPGTSPGDPGAFSNSLGSALDTLKTSGEVFQLPIYDSASDPGNNAVFRLIGFVSVRLLDYDANGPEASRWIRLEFRTDVGQGTCCAHGTDLGTRVVFICAVDKTFPPSNCADR